MRHLKAGRKLGRNASHRLALMRNLSRALILNDSIVTTVAKAKEVRPFIEKLVTLAKKGGLHQRRLALRKLPDRDIVKKLFDEIGPRFADRPGGYTRIIKRHERRLGDAGHTAIIEFLRAGEVKVKPTKAAPAPITRAPEPAPAPAPEAVAPPAPAETTPPATPAPETPAGQ